MGEFGDNSCRLLISPVQLKRALIWSQQVDIAGGKELYLLKKQKRYLFYIINRCIYSERMKNVLQKKKIINSKKQPKNLKGFLSSSKFDFHESSPSVKKCTDKRCMTCPSLIEGTSFTFKNGRTFTVMQDISCKTKNLVYAIICSNCGEFYVGETKTELRTRMTVHRQQTRHQDLTIIRANEHFHDCSGGHFKIFPLYKVNTEGDFLRRRKETLLINILKPSLNDK